MRTLSILSIVCCLLFLFQCKGLESLVQPPGVKLDSAKISNINFDSVSLDFDFKVRNPNPFGIKLSGFDYAFNIEGKRLLSGIENRELNIVAQNESSFSFPVTINFQDAYSLVKDNESRDTLNYHFSGHLTPTGILAGLKIPFSKSGSVPNLRIPKVSLDGLRIDKLSFQGISFQVLINLANPNSFGFDIGHLNYDIALDGQHVASGVTEKLASIPSKGNGEIRLPITLNFSGVMSSILSALSGEKIACSIDGSAALQTPFGARTMPIKSNQVVQIFK